MKLLFIVSNFLLSALCFILILFGFGDVLKGLGSPDWLMLALVPIALFLAFVTYEGVSDKLDQIFKKKN
jgi:hypothetical protein